MFLFWRDRGILGRCLFDAVGGNISSLEETYYFYPT